MKFLLPILLLLASCTTTSKQQTYEFTNDDMLAVQKVSEILPFEMQPGVYLVKVELLDDGTLKNTFQIVDKKLIKYFNRFGIGNIVDKQFVCSDPELKNFLLKGGILAYEVISSKKSFGLISMSKKDCPNLKK
jgi:hypothetical protein